MSTATSPYGYPGPLVVGDGFTEQDWLEACAAMVETLGENRAVTCFVRLNPLFPVNRDMLSSVGLVVYHGDTVNIDLRLSHEQLWAQLRSPYRRDIRRGSEQGLRVVVDDRWDHLDEFISLYHDTMRRVDATAFYFFDRDYFLHLRDVVGDHVHLVLAMVDDVVASGGVFFEAGGIVEYHLGGTRSEYLPQSPFKAVLQFVTTWAKDRSNTDFHLGGGVGEGGGSLLRFKLGFSGDRRPFHTWRIIIQEEPYRSLCARFNPTADPHDLTSFFPLYRDGPAGDPGPSLDRARIEN